MLGGSTTSDIKQLLEIMLLEQGHNVELYESDFNRYEEEILFDNCQLWEFNLDIIYIHTTSKNLDFDQLVASRENELLDGYKRNFTQLWSKIKKSLMP